MYTRHATHAAHADAIACRKLALQAVALVARSELGSQAYRVCSSFADLLMVADSLLFRLLLVTVVSGGGLLVPISFSPWALLQLAP
mmetsp:Transcript_36174/g.84155  ORF Transcript_36174/g.84155 Transcript_36174/m.84155 type:complete len:86 (+) Transcript_36174:46-303(+)